MLIVIGTDDNDQRVEEVINYIHATLTRIQRSIDQNFHQMMSYEPLGTNSSILDFVMSQDYMDMNFDDTRNTFTEFQE